MDSVAIIQKYFGDQLTDRQLEQFTQMGEQYRLWNEKINVISRKDIDHVYLHHILHSLAIAKVIAFEPGSMVMDIGCGGGFPGIPLAVLFPQSQFLMVDSIAKKIKVVDAVAQALGLENVKTFNGRAESVNIQTDYVVSRAVTSLDQFLIWSWRKIRGGDGHGILYLKGGDLAEEIAVGIKGVNKVDSVNVFEVSRMFSEEFFDTKRVLYIKKSKR